MTPALTAAWKAIRRPAKREIARLRKELALTAAWKVIHAAKREIARLRKELELANTSLADYQMAANAEADRVDELTRELAETKRELERWRTGTQIEGDYVSERDLEALGITPRPTTTRSDNLPIGVEPALQRTYERGPGEP